MDCIKFLAVLSLIGAVLVQHQNQVLVEARPTLSPTSPPLFEELTRVDSFDHDAQRQSESAIADYVSSEEEFNLILERLEREHNESIKDNPANYVSEDADLDEILQLIESDRHHDASTSNTYETTTTYTTAASTGRSFRPRLRRDRPSPSVNTDECPICLEQMNPNTQVQLRCGHAFHEKCKDEWVLKAPERSDGGFTCPLCRSVMLD